jgi:2-methylcitrate dehydratase
MMTMRGEMGYDLVLSAPVWGFNDVYFRRQDLHVKRDFGEHVMENVLFKVAYPAEFHAQTAIEAAMRLHPQVVYRVDEVHQIAIQARSIHWSPYDRVGVVNADPQGLSLPAHLSAHHASLSIPTHRDAFELRF